jgi:uncharacterized membrane protein YgcG
MVERGFFCESAGDLFAAPRIDGGHTPTLGTRRTRRPTAEIVNADSTKVMCGWVPMSSPVLPGTLATESITGASSVCARNPRSKGTTRIHTCATRTMSRPFNARRPDLVCDRCRMARLNPTELEKILPGAELLAEPDVKRVCILLQIPIPSAAALSGMASGRRRNTRSGRKFGSWGGPAEDDEGGGEGGSGGGGGRSKRARK